jgi:probable rRNA maturation factor
MDASTDLIVAVDLAIEQAWPALPPDSAALAHALVAATLRQAGLRGSFEVSVTFTDDDALRRLNREFRGIDAATDVLSFPLDDAPLLNLSPDAAWVTRARGDDTHHAAYLGEARDASASSRVDHYSAPVFDPAAPHHLGDIALALPYVARQAQAQGHSFWWELSFLLAHGTLHLIGYDDYYEPGYHAMVALQLAALRELGVVA